MDSSSIELPGSEIENISFEHATLTIQFSRAYIIKTMTGSTERTRWWQRGKLIIERAEIQGEIPKGPLVLAGGDVGENVFTYRDMIPVPLSSRGRVHCDLAFQGIDTRLLVQGESICLAMIDVPKYLEHLRPENSK